MSDLFKNKVAESGIITLNLEDFLPAEKDLILFDLKAFLFMGLILKEKDFREALKQIDVSVYENKTVALTCSADAVIPVWAYMLVSSILSPVAKDVFFGDITGAEKEILIKNIKALDNTAYTDQRVVIKGCGEKHIPEDAYVAITQKLRPVVKSIMYGEPCSTVPVFKKPMQRSNV
ncbi:MAG: hypothetical protein ABS68_08625 [Niastella sp. SCN 39-18]|nr:DUF2480 family protein [Sphingobacteriales bacterium]ODT52625.1 MAG: hypothetical protein ABS68_08625 [Niastella sp. SCN 39-18]OJW11764.1 MAG: hypothetical protein BGO53_12685 [Sphingobacteriales bacterium 39-19]